MDPTALDPFLSMLCLEELSEALDELTSLERSHAISPAEAAAWRERIQCWSTYCAVSAGAAESEDSHGGAESVVAVHR